MNRFLTYTEKKKHILYDFIDEQPIILHIVKKSIKVKLPNAFLLCFFSLNLN